MQKSAVCEFLHGPITSQHAIAALRDALMAGVEEHFEILYYRKDGENINSANIIIYAPVIIRIKFYENQYCDSIHYIRSFMRINKACG